MLKPTLLQEVKQSTTVVYDKDRFARPEDAVHALYAGSGLLVALAEHVGEKELYWALVVVLVEAYESQDPPVVATGNGVVNVYDMALFGGETKAGTDFQREGWTIWDVPKQTPKEYLTKERLNGKVWYLTNLLGSRKILRYLRVRTREYPHALPHTVLTRLFV